MWDSKVLGVKVVGAAVLGTGAVLFCCFGGADVGVAAGEVVFDRDPFIAEIAFDAGGWTVFVFVLEPFASTKLYDGTAVAFDVGAVYTLLWHEVLPFDRLPTVRVWTVQPFIRAVFRRVLFDVTSWK